jgi:hypothetical protein
MQAFQESTTFLGHRDRRDDSVNASRNSLIEIPLNMASGRVVTRRSLERHLFLEPLVISDALFNLL